MTENKPLALHLADCLDYDEFDVVEDSQRTADELRRQHEEITQLRHGAGVANQTIATLVAAHEEDQGVIAVWRGRTQRAEAQRDQLLEALKQSLEEAIYPSKMLSDVYEKARAAIKAVEEGE